MSLDGAKKGRMLPSRRIDYFTRKSIMLLQKYLLVRACVKVWISYSKKKRNAEKVQKGTFTFDYEEIGKSSILFSAYDGSNCRRHTSSNPIFFLMSNNLSQL